MCVSGRGTSGIDEVGRRRAPGGGRGRTRRGPWAEGGGRPRGRWAGLEWWRATPLPCTTLIRLRRPLLRHGPWTSLSLHSRVSGGQGCASESALRVSPPFADWPLRSGHAGDPGGSSASSVAVAMWLRVGAATTPRPSVQRLAVVYEGRAGLCVVLDLQTNLTSVPQEKPLVWGADGLLGARPASTCWVSLRVLRRAGTVSVLGRAVRHTHATRQGAGRVPASPVQPRPPRAGLSPACPAPATLTPCGSPCPKPCSVCCCLRAQQVAARPGQPPPRAPGPHPGLGPASGPPPLALRAGPGPRPFRSHSSPCSSSPRRSPAPRVFTPLPREALSAACREMVTRLRGHLAALGPRLAGRIWCRPTRPGSGSGP